MDNQQFAEIFSEDMLEKLFPNDRADSFFEALFGDVDEGAYDIGLSFAGCGDRQLNFELRLRQRPGKCLACNLTHGLPAVFSRHPVIDIHGVVREIGRLAGYDTEPAWELGDTREISRELHVVPLTVFPVA